MVRFFETPMGRTFYERTMPRLAKAIEQLTTALERTPAPVRYTAAGVGECEACHAPYAIGDAIIGLHEWIPEERAYDAEVTTILCPACATRRGRG